MPGESILTITEYMKAQGIVTRFGRPYVKSAVQTMLSNPFYIGVNRFDRRDYPGAQQRLIRAQVFEQVQRRCTMVDQCASRNITLYSRAL
ncbi:recombinase family protein [bacterium]|nr:MAG: recombinase family protein [bacterium]